MKRVPGVVVATSATVNPTYQLFTSYNTLQSSYTADCLAYYNGRVNLTEWVDELITLRVAAAALNRNASDEFLRCNCRKGCPNKQC